MVSENGCSWLQNVDFLHFFCRFICINEILLVFLQHFTIYGHETQTDTFPISFRLRGRTCRAGVQGEQQFDAVYPVGHDAE